MAAFSIWFAGSTISASARSEGPGKGSEFVVGLPGIVVRYHNQRPNSSPPAEDSVTGHRILVVDDNPVAADALAMWYCER